MMVKLIPKSNFKKIIKSPFLRIILGLPFIIPLLTVDKFTIIDIPAPQPPPNKKNVPVTVMVTRH